MNQTVRSAKLPKSSPSRRISSVLRALDVLADPWFYLILRESFFGVRRFEVFQRNLGIARNILSERLGRLVQHGILTRRAYQDRPPRFEYRLTEAGREFYPAILALMDWGDRWLPVKGGPPLIVTHTDCGRRLKSHVICDHCEAPVLAEDVEAHEGPGAGPERNAVQLATRRSTAGDLYVRGRPCSVARALAAVGDRWSFRIIRESFAGVKRFEDFRAKLCIARNILSTRLQVLVQNGVLSKEQYQDRPERFEYVLTAAGRDLYPALLLLMVWGDRWRRPNKGEPTLLTHKTCKHALKPKLVCSHCGGEVRSDNIKYKMEYSLPS